MNESFNTVITEGKIKADLRTEAETKEAVIELIRQNKGNLYIVDQLNISYNEVVSIRTRYEKAHANGN